jgi:hypothetical protein
MSRLTMSVRRAHHPLGPPTPHASFDVRAFARESERSLHAAESFAQNEMPTVKHAAPSDAPPSSAGAFLPIDDGVFIDVDRTPVLALPRAELAWFHLADVTVRVVLRIVGEVSVRALLALGLFTRAEVAAAFGELNRDGLIHFR